MNYYPFHIGDYAAHTGHLEPMEDLAYRRMLDVYYLRSGALPRDAAEVAKLIRFRNNVADVQSVLDEFFVQTDEGWAHRRCDEELAKFASKSEKARQSAESRWSKANADEALPNPHSDRNANALRPQCEGNAIQNHNHNHNQKEKRETRERGSRLLPDWELPDEWAQWAKGERQDIDCKRVSAAFADYWRAKPGKDGLKLDWFATWRNWVRNERAPPASRGSARQARTNFLDELTGKSNGKNRESLQRPDGDLRRIGYVADVGRDGS